LAQTGQKLLERALPDLSQQLGSPVESKQLLKRRASPNDLNDTPACSCVDPNALVDPAGDLQCRDKNSSWPPNLSRPVSNVYLSSGVDLKFEVTLTLRVALTSRNSAESRGSSFASAGGLALSCLRRTQIERWQ
jgi:hypothetical protein